jgi:hypothetical protein
MACGCLDRLVCNQAIAGSIVVSISFSREGMSKPLRDGLLEVTQLPMIENGHQMVGDIQVTVVINQDMR